MDEFLGKLEKTFDFYLTFIVDKKVNQGQPYLIADGGSHHLNYYRQTMAMKPYCLQVSAQGSPCTDGEKELWNLCGALCTVSDVIVKRYPLKKTQISDTLIFERVDAYSVTEGNYLFLGPPLPEIYFWRKETGLQLVRDGIQTDLLNSERQEGRIWTN
ncbi:MAG: hypothetical protein PUI16_00430 [Clostridia bacterium]|nr:hypothetical protein [Clostridia bacterium]MDY5554729.1 hypothetical protein [Blautia sp.]